MKITQDGNTLHVHVDVDGEKLTEPLRIVFHGGTLSIPQLQLSGEAEPFLSIDTDGYGKPIYEVKGLNDEA